MVLWIGVDDTDSLQGMCTTFLATELVRDLTRDHDLIGYPRLVRLNPNIPWKTRGNGAVCLRLGRGRGVPRPIGRIDGRQILGYPRGTPHSDLERVAERVSTHVERWSAFDDPRTEPGFVVLRSPAPAAIYWRAVREVVTKEQALDAVDGLGLVKQYKGGRGLIGSVAATSWRPRDRTYEVLTYRSVSRWGTPRRLDPNSVIEMDRSYRSTFNNYDHANNRVVIAPRTPCPVLFGIRGDESAELQSAMEHIRGEQPDRWLIFETNQGTDDHVIRSSKARPFRTIRFAGTVRRAPRSLPGGHVVFAVEEIDVTAYEPSKQFRSVVRVLVPGDRVEVVGAVRDAPRTINLEKIRIESLTELVKKIENPVCPSCFTHAKSVGRGLGYRCRGCHQRYGAAAGTWIRVSRDLERRWYEPPAGARRHLSMPLKRLQAMA